MGKIYTCGGPNQNPRKNKARKKYGKESLEENKDRGTEN